MITNFKVTQVKGNRWQISFPVRDLCSASTLFRKLSNLGALNVYMDDPSSPDDDLDIWEFSEEGIQEVLTLLTKKKEEEVLVEMPVSIYDICYLYQKDGTLIPSTDAEIRMNFGLSYDLAGGGKAVPTSRQNHYWYKVIGTPQQVEMRRQKLNSVFKFDWIKYLESSIVPSQES